MVYCAHHFHYKYLYRDNYGMYGSFGPLDMLHKLLNILLCILLIYISYYCNYSYIYDFSSRIRIILLVVY